MKTYSCKDKPLQVFGIPFWEEKQVFERLPLSLRAELPKLEQLGRRCPGARVGFRTDASEFSVKVVFDELIFDIAMSRYGGQSINVLIGDRLSPTFAGVVSTNQNDDKINEKTFTKSNKMEEVTLWLPRNATLSSVEISVPDDATVKAPTPYKYGKTLFYGSSITEGGCACNTTNAYTAILSRWLDMDFYNFGFAGNCLGEPVMADYISTLDFSAFVLDYDYNAPTGEYLEKTHEPFYKKIRSAKPDIPILMMGRPSFHTTDNSAECRTIIKKTYDNAVAAGDKNVYYLDSELFFDCSEREFCTVDTAHPNDVGFYLMAKAILPTMKKMLGIEEDKND